MSKANRTSASGYNNRLPISERSPFSARSKFRRAKLYSSNIFKIEDPKNRDRRCEPDKRLDRTYREDKIQNYGKREITYYSVLSFSLEKNDFVRLDSRFVPPCAAPPPPAPNPPRDRVLKNGQSDRSRRSHGPFRFSAERRPGRRVSARAYATFSRTPGVPTACFHGWPVPEATVITRNNDRPSAPSLGPLGPPASASSPPRTVSVFVPRRTRTSSAPPAHAHAFSDRPVRDGRPSRVWGRSGPVRERVWSPSRSSVGRALSIMKIIK